MLLRYKILCVDDEAANLRLLERLFRNSYDVFTAADGNEALAMLEIHDMAVIITDQRMPGMTGMEFLKRAAEMRRQTVRIILTGYTDAGTLVDAINSGIVYKYVTKPWANEELLATVKRALQHYESMKAQRQLQMHNERLQSRLKSMREALIEVMAGVLESLEPDARKRADRLSQMVSSMAELLQIDHLETEHLRMAAFLKDAVLSRIPRAFLVNRETLTFEERELVTDRLEQFLDTMSKSEDLQPASNTLRYYFERFDGSGFPKGFAGDQIPLSARILAVADEYDLLTNPRDGQKSLTSEDALRSLVRRAGVIFDPTIVDVFCEMFRRGTRLENKYEIVLT